MINSQILQLEDLKKLTGLKREGCIRNRLEKQGIHVFDGANGIWTTMELINAAGLAKKGLSQPPKEQSAWL